MSETTTTAPCKVEREGRKAEVGHQHGSTFSVPCVACEINELRAQLTEVTRENTWLQKQVAADRKSCMANWDKFQAAEASLAPLRAVVEAAKEMHAAWIDAGTSGLVATIVPLAKALRALPADPAAPTPR